MLVFGHSGLPIVLFPTALGRYYETKDFGLIDSVKDFLENGKIKIYCPDTIDNESLLNYYIEPDERINRQIIYENLILNEVIEFAKYESNFDKIALAGCDLGAYQAANNSFKHPDLVSHLITMGGTFDIKRFIFGYYDENCYYNNPPDYLTGLNDLKYIDEINKINIMIGTGEKDICYEENKLLSKILTEKNFLHRFDVLPDADHNWPWWRHMFYNYIKELEY
ncbi:MAG: esterase [Bacteroidetes bacterium]|nr:esterase [Bacteroidota bacterium]